MFATLGLFNSIPCPEKERCTRPSCLFSHQPSVREAQTVRIPVHTPKEVPSSSSSTIPAKRPVQTSSSLTTTSHASSSVEPPTKFRRTGPSARPSAVPTATHTSDGVPLLRVTAAQSQVAVPVRQTMLKNLYEHFCILYQNILPGNPTLASEHALRQEDEVYHKATKLTYRNAVISSIAALKKRPLPDSISHVSVGTDADVAVRAEAQKQMDELRLTAAHIEHHVLSVDAMKQWGYIVDIPPGEGGSRPGEEGSVKTCDRCSQAFKVKRREEADECVYHWGKPYTMKADGERRRLYSCCSRSTSEEGCARGPHVFYDTTPEDLHLRHAFSFTRSASHTDNNCEKSAAQFSDTALDLVALDCEMIYTTGGMRVARVSVVDSAGKEVFDELVRMDDGVEVIDYNTRFSGITEEMHADALLPLKAIRASLDGLISARTIIIGHGLENDLKTLRMIHHRCVDTAIMFPHQSGPPYRRALRTLVKEFLGKTIQMGGGTIGHSSVEDSVATLDLVRWHVLNHPTPKPKATGPTPADPEFWEF